MAELKMMKGCGNYGAEFIDTYGFRCSIQNSSSASANKIWLGVQGNRMHLNQDMAAMLIHYLQDFVDTGDITFTGQDDDE